MFADNQKENLSPTAANTARLAKTGGVPVPVGTAGSQPANVSISATQDVRQTEKNANAPPTAVANAAAQKAPATEARVPKTQRCKLATHCVVILNSGHDKQCPKNCYWGHCSKMCQDPPAMDENGYHAVVK